MLHVKENLLLQKESTCDTDKFPLMFYVCNMREDKKSLSNIQFVENILKHLISLELFIVITYPV